MSIMKEFKEFAVKGNVLDLAIGLIVGAEFGKIINSLVTDIIMPPIGVLIGNANFKDLFFVLRDSPTQPGPYQSLEQAKTLGAATVNWGMFVTTLITFTIVAFCVFMIVKFINRLRK